MTGHKSNLVDPLLDKIQRRTARCAVLGLGMVGAMQSRLLAEAGYSVTGYDIDPDVVRLRESEFANESNVWGMKVSSSFDGLDAADVVFVCVRVGFDDLGELCVRNLESVAKTIRDRCSGPRLIVLVTTVPVGTTEWFGEQLTKDLAEASVEDAERHFLAFVPERIAAHQSIEEVRATPRLVGGIDRQSTQIAESLVERICQESKAVSSPRVAEFSKLLENTFRTHCVALVSEITAASAGWEISAAEVCDAAATKPFGYFPFHPGPGIGGHCLPNDLKLLQQSCSAVGAESDLLKAVQQSTQRMPDDVLKRLQVLLGRPLAGTTVVLVGVGFKLGSPDTTASPAGPLVRQLRKSKASVQFVDHQVHEFFVDELAVPRIQDLRNHESDAVMIVSGDTSIPLEALAGVSDVVLDTGGAAIMAGDRSFLSQL